MKDGISTNCKWHFFHRLQFLFRFLTVKNLWVVFMDTGKMV